MLETFTSLAINSERFNLLKQEMLTNWRNFASERPYTQAFSALRVALNNQQFAPEELADALEAVTPASLAGWRNAALKEVGVKALLHGNLSSKRSSQLRSSLKDNLNIAAVSATQPVIQRVQSKRDEVIEVDHDDSATVLYVQGNDENLSEQARFGLLSQLLRSPFFTSLRTEQQLGYVVAASNGQMHKTPGLAFIVQSPVASNAQVRASTIDFMAKYKTVLEAMPEAEFAAAKGGYLNRLREKDKNQQGRAGRYWGDLLLDVVTFDRREQIAAEVEQLTQANMTDAVAELSDKLENAYFQVSSPGKFK